MYTTSCSNFIHNYPNFAVFVISFALMGKMYTIRLSEPFLESSSDDGIVLSKPLLIIVCISSSTFSTRAKRWAMLNIDVEMRVLGYLCKVLETRI